MQDLLPAEQPSVEPLYDPEGNMLSNKLRDVLL